VRHTLRGSHYNVARRPDADNGENPVTGHMFFLPLLAQIVLVFWLYLRLAGAKALAVRNGQVDQGRRALHDDAWPAPVMQINNCIRNQFEVPVLFYVLMLVAWNLGLAGTVMLVFAWLFVISRYVHAGVHTGSNYVPLRRNVFMLGCLVLMAMTVVILYAILMSRLH